MMTKNKRYYGVDEEEYGAYWILDISNCKKTKEDFLDKNKEIYDLYAWENYLNECAKTLKKNEVVALLDKLNEENQAVKDIINELNSMGFYRDSALLDEYLGKIARAVGCEWE